MKFGPRSWAAGLSMKTGLLLYVHLGFDVKPPRDQNGRFGLLERTHQLYIQATIVVLSFWR